MVFSSLQFIFIFMPIFFLGYYLVPAQYRNAVLLLGSLSFYFVGAFYHPEHFILFLLSILLDFYMGIFMEKRKTKKKLYLGLGIFFHLVALVIFKYAGFLAGELSKLPFLQLSVNVFLPIGISFYTFQGISYLVDVYRGTVRAEKSLLDYAVYISMFEQLIAGPIVTYDTVKNRLHNRIIRKSDVIRGLEVFVFGLGLKVLLANPIGKLFTDVQNIGFESISTPLAWMAIFAFTFQIYFDFFGYSLMAIGLGKMLGFEIPKNFDFPYLSTSMTEFWRRWHITLGSWFREYVYIPLGGNKNGTKRTILNLLIVWLLTGVWHGAGYNFLLWGALLFLIITIEKFFLKKYLDKKPWLGHLYMFFLIPLTWAVFAIEDMGQLATFMGRLFPFFGGGFWSVFRYDYLKYLKLYWIFFVFGTLFSFKKPFELLKKLDKKDHRIISILLFIILAGSVYCMYKGFDDPFLYFRF